MNLIELQHALRQLRLGGIATVLETRLRQAQSESMAPIDPGVRPAERVAVGKPCLLAKSGLAG